MSTTTGAGRVTESRSHLGALLRAGRTALGVAAVLAVVAGVLALNVAEPRVRLVAWATVVASALLAFLLGLVLEAFGAPADGWITAPFRAEGRQVSRFWFGVFLGGVVVVVAVIARVLWAVLP